MFYQSDWAKGTKQAFRPQTAGAEHTQKFTFDVPAAGFAAGDIIELGILPPYAQFTGAMLVPIGGLGASTVDVGIMSGEVGELTNTDNTARTVAPTLFAASPLSASLVSLRSDWFQLIALESARSIGVKFNGSVTTGAGKTIGLMVSFTQ